MFSAKNPLKFVQEDADGNKVIIIPRISLGDAMAKVKNYSPAILDLFDKLLISAFNDDNQKEIASAKVIANDPMNNSQLELSHFLQLVYILESLLAICNDVIKRFGGRVQLIAPTSANCAYQYILHIANDI